MAPASSTSFPHAFLAMEARALLTRLERVKPFALQETMVVAAAPSFAAQTAIELCVAKEKQELRAQVEAFLRWLTGPAGAEAAPDEAQRRFTLVRLRFNAVLSHVDIFAEAMSQRSEAETGVWLSGLDDVCRDALQLPGIFAPPPVMCYLARGPGAAIRRARTRLPGGGENPVAIIRLPRERMISSGLASSLVHEVGHQGAALLDLVTSLRAALKSQARPAGAEGVAWDLWTRWISEIVADLWSIAKVGVTSTAGLIGVVSLPSAFVFRANFDDPHPTPWVRVKLSAAIGKTLYPHPQWDRLAEAWEAFYPTGKLAPDRRALLAALMRTMPAFIERLIEHRPPALHGRTLREALVTAHRQPLRLSTLWRAWRDAPSKMKEAAPCLAFAVIGQARADETMTPEHESRLLADLLRHWALRSTLDASASCAAPAKTATDALPDRAIYPAQAAY